MPTENYPYYSIHTPIDESTARTFRALCALEGISMGEKVAQFIREEISRRPLSDSGESRGV